MRRAVLFLKLADGYPDFPGELVVVEGRVVHRRAGRGGLAAHLGLDDVPGIVVWPGMTWSDVRASWRAVRREFRAMKVRPLPARRAWLQRAVDWWVVRHLRRRPRGWRTWTLDEQLDRLPRSLRRVLARPDRRVKLPWSAVAAQCAGGKERSSRDIRALVTQASVLVRTLAGEEALADLMAQVERALPDTRGRPRPGGPSR